MPVRLLWFVRAALCGAVIALAFPGCDSADNVTPPVPDGGSVVGNVIQFNQAGKSERYRISGWSKAEPKFIWTEGTSARLALPIGKDAGALNLRVTAAGLTGGADLAFQPVEVLANDQKVADWQVGSTAEFNAPIPAELANSAEMLNIEFRIPKATSPKALGQSEDPRVLGMALHHLTVLPAS